MYRLLFQSGRNRGKRVVVRQALTVVGRDPEAHLILADDAQVALRHARLEERSDGVFLFSLAPEYPLLLNGEPVQGEVQLAHGNELTIGQTRIQFQDIIVPTTRQLKPSGGLLQPVTWGIVVALLLIEFALLAFFVNWPRYVIRPETEAADLAFAEERRAQQTEEASPVSAPADPAASSLVALPTSSALAAGDTHTAGTNADRTASPAVPPEILQALHEADFAPADTNAVLVDLPAVSAADPAIEKAQRLLAEASAAAQFADYPKAIRLLNQIYAEMPGFVPAHIEHARLLEQRGDLDGAMERWNRILTLVDVASPHRQQAEERIETLRQQQVLQHRIQQTPSTDSKALPRQIRIVAPSIHKMPSDADVEEMRVLNATLELDDPLASLKQENLQVFVTFYDVAGGGEPTPTEAITTPSPIHFTAPFARHNSIAFDATYIVPRGLRAKGQRETGHKSSYSGYTVHVFAGQTLQDAFARPKRLLELPIHIPTDLEE
ncbi:MAG: FHA domain-containing protein [Verrucomicrobiota bacterium]|jgi:tetratricopeptide (TPR) repeat protein|nr:FHA domain-containing protein [Verrucomicrobiota bacterium]